MASPAQLFWGIMFGAVGSGFFIYGMKQQAAVPILIGAALCVLPYFISNICLMLPVGFFLIGSTFFFRR